MDGAQQFLSLFRFRSRICNFAGRANLCSTVQLLRSMADVAPAAVSETTQIGPRASQPTGLGKESSRAALPSSLCNPDGWQIWLHLHYYFAGCCHAICALPPDSAAGICNLPV